MACHWHVHLLIQILNDVHYYLELLFPTLYLFKVNVFINPKLSEAEVHLRIGPLELWMVYCKNMFTVYLAGLEIFVWDS